MTMDQTTCRLGGTHKTVGARKGEDIRCADVKIGELLSFRESEFVQAGAIHILDKMPGDTE